MFLFYTQSSRDDYCDFLLQGGMYLCRESIVPSITSHQELCDGEVDSKYYALDAQKFELWRFSNDEWVKVGLPYSMQIQEVA